MLDLNPDLYRVFIDGETSTTFCIDALKNAQQMMACEGVIATLFYRIANSKRLRDRYREPQFYDRFVSPGKVTVDPQRIFGPYENVNLKLFAALREMSRQTFDVHSPLMIELVRTYARQFPDEAEAIYDVFLKTTRGVTAPQRLHPLLSVSLTSAVRVILLDFVSCHPPQLNFLAS